MEIAVTDKFSLRINWADAENEPPEIAKTSGFVRISVDDLILTEHENYWSKSVCDEALLAAYPMASWIAGSWWRLMHEPMPVRIAHEWRMAHSLSAAGYGFVWPAIEFATDGEAMEIRMNNTSERRSGPLRYLRSTRAYVPSMIVEREFDRFLETTLARLQAVGVESQLLQSLWNEVLEERDSKILTNFRKLEAALGFDAGESPNGLVETLSGYQQQIGQSALRELGAIWSGNDSASLPQRIQDFQNASGTQGRFLDDLTKSRGDSQGNEPVWSRGWRLAQSVKKQLGQTSDVVTNDFLSTLVGVDVTRLIESASNSSNHRSLGIAIRGAAQNTVKLIPHKRNPPGLRFELARMIGDHVASHSDEKWLPVSDCKTARQKMQRSFATEFLCPIKPLKEFLDGDMSTSAREDAAEHFEVGQVVVAHQLVDHGLISRESAFAH